MSTFSRSLIVVAVLSACSAQAQNKMSPTAQQLYPSLFKKDSLGQNTSKDGVRSLESNLSQNNNGYKVPGTGNNSSGSSSGDNSGMDSITGSGGSGGSGSSGGGNDSGILSSNSGGGTNLGLPQNFPGSGGGSGGGGTYGITDGPVGGGLDGFAGNMGGGLGGIIGNQGSGVSGIGQFVTGILPIIAGASGNSNAASIAGLIGSGVSVYQQGITNPDGTFNMTGLINAGNAALQAGALLTDNDKIDKAAQLGNVGVGLYNLMGNQQNGGSFASGGYNGVNYGQQNGGYGQQNGNMQAVGYNQNGQPVYLMNGQYTTNPSFVQASNGTYGGMPYGATPGIVSGATGASNMGNNNQGLLGGLAQGVSSMLPSLGGLSNNQQTNGMLGVIGAAANTYNAVNNKGPMLVNNPNNQGVYQTKPLPYNNNVQYGTVDTGNTKPLPYSDSEPYTRPSTSGNPYNDSSTPAVQYGTVDTGNTKPLPYSDSEPYTKPSTSGNPYNDSSTPTVQMPSGTSSSAQNLANIGQYNPDITYGPDGATE